MQLNLPVPIISCLFAIEQTDRPVPKRIVLSGRCSPQTFEWGDWSTSPRAYHTRWSIQSLDFWMSGLVDQSPSISCSVVGTVLDFWMSGLVDQSPSISCLVVGTVPRLPNKRAGRLVPEHIMLGGRYSPQTIKWTDQIKYLAFEKIVSSH